MCTATLVIAGRQWVWPVMGFLILALGALFWAYRGAPQSAGTRAACLAAKLAGIAVLCACLLDPLWGGQRVRPGANLLVVLADNSQGMQNQRRDSKPEPRRTVARLVEPAEGRLAAAA